MAIETRKPKKGLIAELQMGGVAFGFFLVGLGIILLLRQMRIIPTDDLFHFFWPAVMIFFGVQFMFSRSRYSQNCFRQEAGGFLTLAGVVLLLSKLGYFPFSFSIVWALGFIYWGIWIVARTFGFRRWWETQNGRAGDGNVIDVNENDPPKTPADVSATFGTSKRAITTKNFKNARLEAIFGEVGFDLTRADIEGDEAVIQADSVFGACVIRVPMTWHISVRGSAVMGEFIDKTRQQPIEGPGVKTLIVTGSAVFGSVEVKN